MVHSEANPANYRVHVPTKIDVKSIRKATGLSLSAFAQRFEFPIGTLRDLEQSKA